MKVFGINTCQTYKKTLAWFDKHGIDYEAIDYRVNPLSSDQMKEAHEKSGLDIKAFFNTSGKLYKTYGLKETYQHMSLEEIYALLSKEPMLIKRPLVVGDDFVFVGFKASTYKDFWHVDA